MTDNEIIEALEEMAEYSDFLEDIRVAENALNLINRQKAEIERLNGNLFTISNACMQRRNEAIKEFAEKVKKYCEDIIVFEGWYEECKLIDYIEDLVKEMAGKRHE